MLCSCIDCKKKCPISYFYCSNECSQNLCRHRISEIKNFKNSLYRSLGMSTNIYFQLDQLNLLCINDIVCNKNLIANKKNYFAFFFSPENLCCNEKFKWFSLSEHRMDQDKKFYMKDIYGNEERVSRKVINYYKIYNILEKMKYDENTNYLNFNNFEIICLAYINIPSECYINKLCIGLNITYSGEYNIQYGNWVKKDGLLQIVR